VNISQSAIQQYPAHLFFGKMGIGDEEVVQLGGLLSIKWKSNVVGRPPRNTWAGAWIALGSRDSGDLGVLDVRGVALGEV